MNLTSRSHLGRVSTDLLIRIDPRSGTGLQQQIYASIRRAILDGVAAPGVQLASSRALASDLCVSRTTTLLAYEQLIAEGYVTSRHGSGTFVAQVLPDDSAPLRAPRRAARLNHPPLSKRGAALAATSAPPQRMPGPSRPFRLGAPALDLFPHRVWSQLVNRRLRSITVAQLDYSDPAGFEGLR